MTLEKSGPFSLADRLALTSTHQSLVSRVQELETLLEIGKAITTQFEIDAILRQIVSEATRLTEAEASLLLLIDPESQDLYLRAEQNIDKQEARNFKVKISDSVAGLVIQTKEPLLLNPGQDDIKVKTGFTVKSLINVPLIFRNEVIGVLGVNNREKNTPFDENHLRVVQALADWAAIAITNARLYRETERGSKSMSLINKISRSILSSLHVEEIPHKLIQQTTETLGAECGSLALVDEATNELVFQLAYNGQGEEIKEMRQFRLPLGQGIIGAVALDGRPRIVADVKQSNEWYSKMDGITQFTTKEVMAAPLQTEGQIIGVVELLNKQVGPFTPDDQDLLMAVASAAAIAIQNARQYEALVKAHRDLSAAQRQRIATEQWSILGRAAAGLAHRIHNTTAIVPASAQDLRELLTQVKMPAQIRQEVEGNLSRIERNTIHTLDLADELLRRFHHQPEATDDVNAMVLRAIAQTELPDNITLEQSLASALPPVQSSTLLADAIAELIDNAVKAMPNGGHLTLSTYTTSEMITIKVSDTGHGIPPERQQKIFTLFYGQNGGGLGFGLWWIKTFMQQHLGSISVESEPGQGATFTISLPISEQH